jgi:putative ABC transport system permease protein
MAMTNMGIVSACFTGAILVLAAVVAVLNPKLFLLIFKNLRRNVLRTALTGAAIVVLAVMVTLIWTVIRTLDSATEDKSQDFKLIITERWQLPSQMPMTHGFYLDPEDSRFMPELRGLIGKGDFMTWSFYGGSTDKDQVTFETLVFFFCMNPNHIKSMMDGVEDVDDNVIGELNTDVRKVLLGKERMEKLGLKVGSAFTLYGLDSFGYKGIDLEFIVAGELPGSQYGLSGIMNAEYFNRALDKWPTNSNNKAQGSPHPLSDKRLSLVWLRVRDKDAYTKVAYIIENSPNFASRPVKVETAASGIAAFLDAYRDLLWGMKWLLVPAILVSMTLVISNAIAITVRERRTEMAVMKVLGFRPLQIQTLILGEAILVGSLSGLLATSATLLILNGVFGGLPFPIAFFPAFTVPWEALLWGFAIGGGTGLLGSILPAQTARSVKVSEVFAKVA